MRFVHVMTLVSALTLAVSAVAAGEQAPRQTADAPERQQRTTEAQPTQQQRSPQERASQPSAQQPSDAPRQQPEGGEASLMEAQERVMKAQQEALDKPAVKQELEVLEDLVEAKMVEQDPEAKKKLDRLEGLQTRLEEMSQEPDPDPTRAAPILEEAQQLAIELGELQAQVLQDEQVQNRMEAFDSQLMEEMREIDPQVPQLMARLEQAQQQQMRQQQAPQGSPESPGSPGEQANP